VRDAVLARTAELDVAAWDLLNLLTCAPGAIPDRLLTGLGVGMPALPRLDEANLIRRTSITLMTNPSHLSDRIIVLPH
jgi:hypothetical protein